MFTVESTNLESMLSVHCTNLFERVVRVNILYLDMTLLYKKKLIKLTLINSLLWEARNRIDVIMINLYESVHRPSCLHIQITLQEYKDCQRVNRPCSKDTQWSFHVSTMLFLLKCVLSCWNQTGSDGNGNASCLGRFTKMSRIRSKWEKLDSSPKQDRMCRLKTWIRFRAQMSQCQWTECSGSIFVSVNKVSCPQIFLKIHKVGSIGLKG